jgi:hypothetical protein
MASRIDDSVRIMAARAVTDEDWAAVLKEIRMCLGTQAGEFLLQQIFCFGVQAHERYATKSPKNPANLWGYKLYGLSDYVTDEKNFELLFGDSMNELAIEYDEFFCVGPIPRLMFNYFMAMKQVDTMNSMGAQFPVGDKEEETVAPPAAPPPKPAPSPNAPPSGEEGKTHARIVKPKNKRMLDPTINPAALPKKEPLPKKEELEHVLS